MKASGSISRRKKQFIYRNQNKAGACEIILTGAIFLSISLLFS